MFNAFGGKCLAGFFESCKEVLLGELLDLFAQCFEDLSRSFWKLDCGRRTGHWFFAPLAGSGGFFDFGFAWRGASFGVSLQEKFDGGKTGTVASFYLVFDLEVLALSERLDLLLEIGKISFVNATTELPGGYLGHRRGTMVL